MGHEALHHVDPRGLHPLDSVITDGVPRHEADCLPLAPVSCRPLLLAGYLLGSCSAPAAWLARLVRQSLASVAAAF